MLKKKKKASEELHIANAMPHFMKKTKRTYFYEVNAILNQTGIIILFLSLFLKFLLYVTVLCTKNTF